MSEHAHSGNPSRSRQTRTTALRGRSLRVGGAWALLVVLMFSPPARAADDPCSGASALLAVLDRPTVADSPCVVKPGHAVIEAGYADETLPGLGGGRLITLPQAELRFGLPHRLEFVVLPPNYNHQTTSPSEISGRQTVTGYGDSTVGAKYEFGYTRHWVFAADTLLSLPTGNHGFGGGGRGLTLNAIAGYSLTPRLGMSGMLGVSSLTGHAVDGTVQRYHSLDPDVVVTYLFSDRLQMYAEGYGQTHTGPDAGAGYAADGGFQYLITPRFEIDIERGEHLSGDVGYTHYVGVGLGIEF